MSGNPLDIIAAPPPEIPHEEVLAVLAEEYGLEGLLTVLISERDQNFRLDTADGNRLVVKIANAAEPAEITDFQVQALLFLEEQACPIAVPRVIRTRTGAVSTSIRHGQTSHVLRLVSYVPGRPLEGIEPGPEIAFQLGRTLGQLDRFLDGFSHCAESQVLLWDMQRAGHLQDIMHHVPEGGALELVADCLGRFTTVVEPAFAVLRTQVIHNDLNPGNVLVDDAQPPAVTGVIDFGDMLRAPLVIDVAIAASYLRAADEELSTIRALVAGFESVIPLEQAEKDILYDLIRTRLATTIAILHWRAAARSGDDPYLGKVLQERSAERFLLRLSALGEEAFCHCVFSAKN